VLQEEGKRGEGDDRTKLLQPRARRLRPSQSGAASAFHGGLEVWWTLPARDCQRGRNDFSSGQNPAVLKLDDLNF